MNDVVLRFASILLHGLGDNSGTQARPSTKNHVQTQLQASEPGSADAALWKLLSVMTSTLSRNGASNSLCCFLIAKLLQLICEADVSVVVVQRAIAHVIQRVRSWLLEDTVLQVDSTLGGKYTLEVIVWNYLTDVHHLLHNPNDTVRWLANELTLANVADGQPNMIFHEIVGPSINCTTFCVNTVHMDIPVSREFTLSISTRPVRNVGYVVALFDCSLELTLSDSNITYELDPTYEHELGRSAEYAFLEALADCFQRSHVTLVACQKRAHPYLHRVLRAKRIILIERVSIRYMGALQTLCGGRILSSVPSLHAGMCATIPPFCLGFLEDVCYEHKFDKPFVIAVGYEDSSASLGVGSDRAATREERLQDHLLELYGHRDKSWVLPFVNGVVSRQSTYTTILCTAPNEAVVTAWKAAIESCVQRLQGLQAPSSLLPGGGMWQAYVARKLRLCGLASAAASNGVPITRIHRHFHAVEEMVARCLEDFALLAGAQDHHEDGLWGRERMALFQLPVAPEDGFQQGERIEFGNPDGAKVRLRFDVHRQQLVLVPRSENECTESERKYASYPPLDDLRASMLALQIAGEFVCAVVNIDEVVYLNDDKN